MSRLVSCMSLAAALGLVVWLVVPQAQGQAPKKKPPRVASVHVIMECIVGPNCKALANGLKKGDADALPKLANHAALLNEASFILVQNGRCPDRTWAQAAARLRRCSAVVYEKLKDKDLQGAQSAFKAMTQACANCHKAHRKD